MDKLSTNTKIAIGVALALVLNVTIDSVLEHDEVGSKEPPRIETITLSDAGVGAPVKANEYHRAFVDWRDDAGLGPDDAGRLQVVDLLTREVQPGETIGTDVNVPAGHAVSQVVLTGPSVGRFTLLSTVAAEREDGQINIAVTARNTSPDALRFTAVVELEAPP